MFSTELSEHLCPPAAGSNPLRRMIKFYLASYLHVSKFDVRRRQFKRRIRPFRHNVLNASIACAKKELRAGHGIEVAATDYGRYSAVANLDDDTHTFTSKDGHIFIAVKRYVKK